MRWPTLVALCAAAAAAALTSAAQTPNPSTSKDALVVDKGMPPRAAPTDYAAHVQAGSVMIAADFTGHNAHVQDGLLTTEDYVVVEVGVFGAPEAKLTFSIDDFSLRINGGKKTLPRQPYELVTKSLKDPDYQEPETNKTGKTVINSGGSKDGVDPNAPPPALIPVPFAVRHGWELRVKRDSLPIGDRSLPQAGLLFFPYGSGTKGIRSIELIYSGAAGKATLSIHP
jgi:hypothetical protein